ncbi:MAG: Tyrosine-specific transport protein [Chlamydiales bacterium]|nr:Tyrosine-specific transport protein [Chlamydiales bacterium]
MIAKSNRLVGAVLLVSGTTIGAGMLALPVTTGLAGFIPSLVIMTAIWLFMMLTAFYLLEVNLRMKGESNLISMMHKTLGRPGEIVSWITYLLLLYSLAAAYMVGCSHILEDVLSGFLPFDLPEWTWPVLIFCLFAVVVYFGTQVVDFLNRALMIGLVVGYLFVLGMGGPQVNPTMLAHFDWNFLLPSISVVLTTFGYHIIIPTLTTYLEHDSRLLKRAIFIGSLIPFVIYVLWQLLVMGVVPVDGPQSLSEASQKGLQVTFFLKTVFGSPWIILAIRSFAFFAIVTSLLGVTLSLSDFLADGLNIKKGHKGKVVLILFTFVPPLLFALFYHEGFITALKYAGLFVVILLALLPSLMAWFERYGPETERSFIKSDFRVPGGKTLVVFTAVVSIILLGVEVAVL